MSDAASLLSRHPFTMISRHHSPQLIKRRVELAESVISGEIRTAGIVVPFTEAIGIEKAKVNVNLLIPGDSWVDPTQYSEFGIHQSAEERQTLLEELKTDYANLLDKEKPGVIFVQSDSDTVEGATLEELLHRHGPFPLEEHITARIIRDVSSAIMFLHSRDVIHGSLDLTSIIVTPNFNAKTIVTTKAYRAKHSESGAKAKVEDVFHLGMILYRMLTGRKAEFDQSGRLSGGPSPYLRISEKGLKLAEFMLSRSTKFPPTIGHIRYSEWLEQCEGNPPVFVIFPNYE